MPLNPLLKRAYLFLVFLGLFWVLSLVALVNPTIQRHALYAHKVHTAWWEDLNQPEKWGFLRNQIQPFFIKTPDAQTLYVWHILPTKVYFQNEKELLNRPSGPSLVSNESTSLRLLASQGGSKPLLVIYFHGNAGTVSQGWRTDTYRSIAGVGPSQIHILAFDYRGFGYSTGQPTEQGLIADGVAVVDWALKFAQVPAERIVLAGQSLGTAVLTAVAEHFSIKRSIDFAGLVLIAGFSDLPTLLKTYSIKGVIPILSPLRPYPQLQKLFCSQVIDTWRTADRLQNVVRSSEHLLLHLIHSRDDPDINWSHSDALFQAAANATSERGLNSTQIDQAKMKEDLGPAGWRNTWLAEGIDGNIKHIKQVIALHGGHNRIATYGQVSQAILESFGNLIVD